MPQPDGAVLERPHLPAERGRHPIITKIDERMPEIAEMLPDGMNPDRFRRVVVQALVRNPDLWDCTPVSVVTAIVEAAQIGLEPTGVLGRAWMLPYNSKQPNGSWAKEAKLIVGYRGYAELAWRADQILVTTGAVRQGDEFTYQRGTEAFLRHVPASDDPDREADDDNITDFWAMYTLPDGRRDFDVMSRKAAERIRERAKKKNPVWDSDFGEMGRKTVLRRLLKVAPLSPEVQRVLGRDEEVDFDTPVERVADPKRDELRSRISQRTAALRGESTGESEAGVPTGGAEPEEGARLPSSGGSPARRGDPWMARLHAVGAERGLEHEALSEWAQQLFKVSSLTELDPKQRGQFMARVEALPVPGETCAHPPAQHIADEDGVRCGACGAVVASRATDTPVEQAVGPAAPATTQGEGAASPPGGPSPASAPFTDPAALETYAAAVLGFEQPQPLKDLTPADFEQVWGSLGLADLASYQEWYPRQERAVRQALMAAKQSPRHRADAVRVEPQQESLAEALGAPVSDR